MTMHSRPGKESGKQAFKWRGYLTGLGLVVAATLLGCVVQTFFAPANIIMVYPLCVTISAVMGGLGPSIMVSVLSVLAFDFFFVTPLYTFAVDDTQYIFTFIILLLVGMTISYLTSRIRQQTESAKQRERETAALYALGRDLAISSDLESYIQAIIRRVREALGHEIVIFLPDVERLVRRHLTACLLLYWWIAALFQSCLPPTRHVAYRRLWYTCDNRRASRVCCLHITHRNVVPVQDRMEMSSCLISAL